MMATGAARGALLRRLLLCTDATLAKLRGVTTEHAVVLLHERGTEDLPWVDAATYLTRAPRAPGLLLPTTAALDVPADALLEALRRVHPKLTVPCALWPARRCVVPLAGAVTVDRAGLREALEVT